MEFPRLSVTFTDVEYPATNTSEDRKIPKSCVLDKYLPTLEERAAALSLRLDLVFRDALASACIAPDGADVWRVNTNIARVENRNAVRARGHPRKKKGSAPLSCFQTARRSAK